MKKKVNNIRFLPFCPRFVLTLSHNNQSTITNMKKQLNKIIAGVSVALALYGCANQTTSFDELGHDLAYRFLVLKAKEMGFDTLIMGLRDADGLKKALGIPSDETVMTVVDNATKRRLTASRWMKS